MIAMNILYLISNLTLYIIIFDFVYSTSSKHATALTLIYVAQFILGLMIASHLKQIDASKVKSE